MLRALGQLISGVRKRAVPRNHLSHAADPNVGRKAAIPQQRRHRDKQRRHSPIDGPLLRDVSCAALKSRIGFLVTPGSSRPQLPWDCPG